MCTHLYSYSNITAIQSSPIASGIVIVRRLTPVVALRPTSLVSPPSWTTSGRAYAYRIRYRLGKAVSEDHYIASNTRAAKRSAGHHVHKPPNAQPPPTALNENGFLQPVHPPSRNSPHNPHLPRHLRPPHPSFHTPSTPRSGLRPPLTSPTPPRRTSNPLPRTHPPPIPQRSRAP